MATRAEDGTVVEVGDGCVLVQDSEKNYLFGIEVVGPWGENLVVIGRSQKERRRGRSFGFLDVWVIEGKCVFSFENGDGKGSVQLKNGDGELTERGAAAFWRRDGDGGTAERGMGVLVKGRGDNVWPERDP
ncbi:hypothetical protein NC653_001940 [Populus alba x Populus x berolinensis]|uniref:Uncharacterized protein n=1 Tax=Populus alba x Populus x berolinensis TaxID=444605 RepID=A0AAD6WIJ1_9ROSI|nr:hypothetical protein NC653_001940 [Populus alba x Populus x berolinensis]